jgi:enoyl-CoA hydratase/carnithine racemase
MAPAESNGAPATTVSVRFEGEIAHVRLERAAKRNAIDTATVVALERAFAELPQSVRVAVLSGAGAHFCAGLDLTALTESAAADAMFHSRLWHRAFEHIQFGRVPVVAVLHGAVVGGGLELAASTHIRVAEQSAFYALPEGQRGIFLGGGGTARLARIIGVPSITDMMLTGRTLSAEEGHTLGVSQYLVEEGAGMQKALELALKIAGNTPLTNFAVTHALPRIADMAQDHGLLMEAMMSAIVQDAPEAKARLQAFLDKRASKVEQPVRKPGTAD